MAGLASVEVAPAGQGGEDSAPEGEAQARSRGEADCQTNRAVIAAISQGFAAGGEAEQQLQVLAEAAGVPGQHVLLLALCHACASGRATDTGGVASSIPVVMLTL